MMDQKKRMNLGPTGIVRGSHQSLAETRFRSVAVLSAFPSAITRTKELQRKNFRDSCRSCRPPRWEFVGGHWNLPGGGQQEMPVNGQLVTLRGSERRGAAPPNLMGY